MHLNQFSHSVVSDSLWPHGMQHSRLPCPSPTPRACSNSCSLSRWCYSTILSSYHPLLLPSALFPSIRVFSNESSHRIRWPNYWSFSFSISPSNECAGLISFRIDWFDLVEVQGTLKSLLHHSSKASILWCSAFWGLRQLKKTDSHKQKALCSYCFMAFTKYTKEGRGRILLYVSGGNWTRENLE